MPLLKEYFDENGFIVSFDEVEEREDLFTEDEDECWSPCYEDHELPE